MKKLKTVFIFSVAWFLSALLILSLATAILPANENGKITVGAGYTITILVVPIVCGIMSVKYLSKRYYFARKVTPQMVRDAIQLLPNLEPFSISMLQRKLEIRSFNVASDLANELEELGFVKKYPDFTWKIIRNQHGAIARPVQKMGMSAIDCMEGHAFEFWCADILRKNGFIDVEVTRGSGDQGVDILAKKAGIKYAIQCKCYATDLGNKPVQEVNTGKTIYHCHVGAVMTNRYFTEGAKQAADATGVLLWNRDDVKKMAEIAGVFTSTPL